MKKIVIIVMIVAILATTIVATPNIERHKLFTPNIEIVYLVDRDCYISDEFRASIPSFLPNNTFTYMEDL